KPAILHPSKISSKSLYSYISHAPVLAIAHTARILAGPKPTHTHMYDTMITLLSCIHSNHTSVSRHVLYFTNKIVNRREFDNN
ncbi:hypothetical protein ACJX0J_018181, partial [Zea mays]